ncbi:MAG: hypothetical protein JKY48_15010 [Flavobacteriales bacterium]|nr:hypothetical protein [Flavobacteriales bacterium]
MPSLNFTARFSNQVERGIKKQSIRRSWGVPVVIDDALYLFSGMGTYTCKRLRSTRCYDVADVFIGSNTSVILNNRVLTDGEKNELATDEGFDDFKQMFRFCKQGVGLPFEGQVIKWL